MQFVMTYSTLAGAIWFLLFLPFWFDTSKGNFMQKVLWKVVPVSIGFCLLFTFLKTTGLA